MGLFPSKVQDELLAEKLQAAKDAADDDNQVTLELRYVAVCRCVCHD